jgi:hypothetical protein
MSDTQQKAIGVFHEPCQTQDFLCRGSVMTDADIVPLGVFTVVDMPDDFCEDPFTAHAKKMLALKDRFAHLDAVLRGCADSEDPIYRAAAEMYITISETPS